MTQRCGSVPFNRVYGMSARILVAAWLACASAAVHAQDATFATRSLTPETALKAAQAALESCRKAGYQVGVAVTDRAGVPQVVLRDRFGGPHGSFVGEMANGVAASYTARSIPYVCWRGKSEDGGRLRVRQRRLNERRMSARAS